MDTPQTPEGPTAGQRRKNILTRVEGYVCKDRMKQHGEAEDNLGDIADFWMIWMTKRGLLAPGAVVTRLDVCQMMSLMKAARKINNMHAQDNWDDDAGYQVIGAAIAETERESKKS